VQAFGGRSSTRWTPLPSLLRAVANTLLPTTAMPPISVASSRVGRNWARARTTPVFTSAHTSSGPPSHAVDPVPPTVRNCVLPPEDLVTQRPKLEVALHEISSCMPDADCT